jgi:NitT/TauT family transport system substrate-binding protein
VTLPAPELTSVRVAQSGVPTSGAMPSIMATCLGLYKKYGLDETDVVFQGAGPGLQAMIAGQVDVAMGSGGPTIASLATDFPTQIVFVTRSNINDDLFAQSDIKTGEALKGKSVAISSFGSQSHAGALLALKSLGLTPEDVTITQVGNDSARLAALQAGAVGASMQDFTREATLVDAGFTPLVKLREVNGLGGVPLTSLVVTPDFLAKNPNTVMALVAALEEGQVAWRTNPEKAYECLSTAAEESPEDAKDEIDQLLASPWSPLDGRCNNEIMEFTKSVLVATDPSLESVDASKACDNSVIDKLDSMGFLEQIGSPPQ